MRTSTVTEIDLVREPLAWGPFVSPEGVRYSIWAPERDGLEVQIESGGTGKPRVLRLVKDAFGFHRVTDSQGRPGDRYRFRVNGMLLPDPASRAQAGTVHEASMVVDSRDYRWTDGKWRRPRFRDLVIYELHVGTFTPAGTFRSVIEKLPYLLELGVNAIELMPIADFPGNRSWGYDGVLIYAPARAYGSPDDLRALVDAAHAHGLAVILDVVYNHLGPDGNYLGCYTRHFSTERHHTPWGAAFNLDDEMSAPVREFFLSNPLYWMEEFHIDGFRLDATHEIADDSPKHLLAEMAEAIHARGGYVIAEDARNERSLLLSPEQGGMGLDAVWADDFHHTARVMQTGEREGYYGAYRGSLPELIDTLRHGWHYRGQQYRSAGRTRGTECADLPPSKFLHCFSNHDQVGNRAFGERISADISPDAYRALSMLLCLSPYTPMLFMGQEWAASTPFRFFTDHNDELGRLVSEGRRREFAGFSAFTDPAALVRIPDPQAAATFDASKLQWPEITAPAHAPILALYRECLQLRRNQPAFRPENRESWRVEAIFPPEGPAKIGVIRFCAADADFLLLFSLTGGGTADLGASEVTAAPTGQHWSVALSSDEPRFGGKAETVCDGKRCAFQSSASVLLRSEKSA